MDLISCLKDKIVEISIYVEHINPVFMNRQYWYLLEKKVFLQVDFNSGFLFNIKHTPSMIET